MEKAGSSKDGVSKNKDVGWGQEGDEHNCVLSTRLVPGDLNIVIHLLLQMAREVSYSPSIL